MKAQYKPCKIVSDKTTGKQYIYLITDNKPLPESLNGLIATPIGDSAVASSSSFSSSSSYSCLLLPTPTGAGGEDQPQEAQRDGQP